MERSERFFQRWRRDSIVRDAGPEGRADLVSPGPSSGFGDLVEETSLRLSSSLVLACEVRDLKLDIISHSARVARTCRRLGELLGMREGEIHILESAAELHEIGMISVPLEILTRAGPLESTELARVRLQAVVGAEIVRAANDERIATLVEVQYHTYSNLSNDGSLSPDDLLLAGMLRVADALDALQNPRPYQEQMAAETQAERLRSGMGTDYHPLAVHAGLQFLCEANG